jgi:hypothetical protein
VNKVLQGCIINISRCTFQGVHTKRNSNTYTNNKDYFCHQKAQVNLDLPPSPHPKGQQSGRRSYKGLVELEGMALTLDADIGFRAHKF